MRVRAQYVQANNKSRYINKESDNDDNSSYSGNCIMLHDQMS